MCAMKRPITQWRSCSYFSALGCPTKTTRFGDISAVERKIRRLFLTTVSLQTGEKYWGGQRWSYQWNARMLPMTIIITEWTKSVDRCTSRNTNRQQQDRVAVMLKGCLVASFGDCTWGALTTDYVQHRMNGFTLIHCRLWPRGNIARLQTNNESSRRLFRRKCFPCNLAVQSLFRLSRLQQFLRFFYKPNGWHIAGAWAV